MLSNYFKIAFRNLKHNKAFAFINIMGMGIALAACLVIFLVLRHEYSFDTYHKNADHIYEIVKNDITADGDNFNIGMPFPSVKALRNDFPQANFAALYYTYGGQISLLNETGNGVNKKFIERDGIFYAEPEIFGLFDVSWLSGAKEILKDDNTVVLSKSVANRYFGNWESAIGKNITLDNAITARISGIIEDVPANSDFPFKIIFSYRSMLSHSKELGFGNLDNWNMSWSSNQVYALLPASVTAESINQGFKTFLSKYQKDNPNVKSNHKVQFLQPLRNVHFDTRFSNNGDHVSSKTSLYTLGFIGMLILLMACINFINLSTALAVKRNKEVGIRKVLGSNAGQLTVQVMVETLVLVIFGAIIGLLFAYYSLPYVKYIVDVNTQLTLFSMVSIVFLIATITIVTLLAGVYPAWVVSRFKPVEAMKNKISTSQLGGISLRRVLVVLQFTFSQVLIIATIIVLEQMHFIEHANLGFNKEAVLLVHGNSDSASLARMDAFKQELLRLPEVKSVSFSNDAPSSGNSWMMNFAFDNSATDKDFSATLKFADESFADVYGLKMVAGTFYTQDSTPQLVINETMAKKIGLKSPEEALGKTMRVSDGKWAVIKGVVMDFKTNSLKEALPPIVLMKQKKFYGVTGIKLRTTNLSQANANIQRVWDKYYPEYAFDSNFFDESINKFYVREQRMSALYKIYAFLAIFISCLGLYGLVSFMALQKTKEVGIRKVLGASIGNILYLFSKEFTLLILIAFMIAAPIGYYFMHQWLLGFAFRIDIEPYVFIIAFSSSILIAWITVGYKALRAALANPVKSLRTE